MFKRILFLFSCVLLSMVSTAVLADTIQLPQTGQTKCYDTAGLEIPCAGTGQDGEIRPGVAWPMPRFTIGTGAESECVTDNLTGLIWARNGNLYNSAMTWYQAIDYVNNLNLCCYSDWQVPNVNELESLVNANEPNPATWLNTQGFYNVQSNEYWSDSTFAGNSSVAWNVYLGDGTAGGVGKDNSRYVWAVRAETIPPAEIWKTGQTTSYVAGDDGDMERGVIWPYPRFMDNYDGTVTDNLTGLIWTSDANAPGPPICQPGKSKTWQGTLDYVTCLNTNSYLGYNDWRLPNRKELRSLIDYSNYDPALPTGHPFTNVLPKWYRSSTTFANSTPNSWIVDMTSGYSGGYGKATQYDVWPVRAGSGFFCSRVSPTIGSNTGNVTVRFQGAGFTPITTVKLICQSQEILPEGTNFVNFTEISATFNLTNKTIGICDVVLSKPEEVEIRIPNSFTIIKGGLITTLHNTGVDDNGNLLPDGAIDPHYTLIESADSRYPGPEAYVTIGYTPHWTPNGSAYQWVSPFDYTGMLGGNYIYRTAFDLTGFDPTSAVITGQYSVDNNMVDIQINGLSIGAVLPGGHDTYYPFTIDKGFVAGVNVIDFITENFFDGGTPAGLVVEMQGTANTGICSSPGDFAITSVMPNKGGNTGSVTVQVKGCGFDNEAIVKLVRDGQLDILGSQINVINEGRVIETTFDLTDKLPGEWDIVLTNPDANIARFSNGFTVESGGEAKLWVDIVGRELITLGREWKYQIVYGNSGNIDSNEEVIIVSRPDGTDLSIVGAVGAYGDLPLTPIIEGSEKAYGVFIPKIIASRTDYITLKVVALSGQETTIQASYLSNLFYDKNFNINSQALKKETQLILSSDTTGATPPIGSTVFMGPHADSPWGHEGIVGEKDGQLGVWDVWLGGFYELEDWKLRVGGKYLGWGTPLTWDQNIGNFAALLAGEMFRNGPPTFNWRTGKNYGGLGYSCSGFTEFLYEMAGLDPLPFSWELFNLTPGLHYRYFTGKTDFYDSEQDLYKFLKPIMWLNQISDYFDGDLISMLRHSAVNRNINIVSSIDPNDKAGPAGYDPLGTSEEQKRHFIAGDRFLNYMVFFENLESATAPAQEVTITDQLDLTNLDLNTFSFGTISFGSNELTISQGENSFSSTVDLRPDMNILVNVQGELDTNTGLIKWLFKSIDPDTGRLPDDPMVGFLPPNINPPEGQGYVSFGIKPKVGLATGTEIRNKASITFDFNQPIDTQEVFNTIDSGIPTSSVSPLSATQTAPIFTVNWSGSDDEGGSGIKNYDIYVSDDGSPYTLWLTTTEISATFTGANGHQYSFYSRARDNVGDIEDAPANPDATTTITGSQYIRVILPNGGDVIPSGGIYGICWEAPNNAVKFDLKYSTDNGGHWTAIKSVTGLNCTHWEGIPVVTANKNKCRVKVIGYDSNSVPIGEDISDKPFTIEVLRVISPNGGETLKSGDTSTIRWITHKTIRPVAKTVLKYTTDGATWKPIKTLTGNPGSFNWNVPAISSTKCKVKVILKDASGANIGTDISDKVFTIQP